MNPILDYITRNKDALSFLAGGVAAAAGAAWSVYRHVDTRRRNSASSSSASPAGIVGPPHETGLAVRAAPVPTGPESEGGSGLTLMLTFVLEALPATGIGLIFGPLGLIAQAWFLIVAAVVTNAAIGPEWHQAPLKVLLFFWEIGAVGYFIGQIQVPEAAEKRHSELLRLLVLAVPGLIGFGLGMGAASQLQHMPGWPHPPLVAGVIGAGVSMFGASYRYG
ncbi:MAG: hypothetical protein QOJ27_1240 [Sphingomonadales bacterium]|nr:hypothetical protein [Sphingomonadales bacterium]